MRPFLVALEGGDLGGVYDGDTWATCSNAISGVLFYSYVRYAVSDREQRLLSRLCVYFSGLLSRRGNGDWV